MNQVTYNKMTSTLSELTKRATAVGYKNALPHLPAALVGKPGLSFSLRIVSSHAESCMAGFRKRLGNWLNGLYSVESTSGQPIENRIDVSSIFQVTS